MPSCLVYALVMHCGIQILLFSKAHSLDFECTWRHTHYIRNSSEFSKVQRLFEDALLQVQFYSHHFYGYASITHSVLKNADDVIIIIKHVRVLKFGCDINCYCLSSFACCAHISPTRQVKWSKIVRSASKNSIRQHVQKIIVLYKTQRFWLFVLLSSTSPRLCAWVGLFNNIVRSLLVRGLWVLQLGHLPLFYYSAYGTIPTNVFCSKIRHVLWTTGYSYHIKHKSYRRRYCIKYTCVYYVCFGKTFYVNYIFLLQNWKLCDLALCINWMISQSPWSWAIYLRITNGPLLRLKNRTSAPFV